MWKEGHGCEHCCDDGVGPVGSNVSDRSVGGLLVQVVQVVVGGKEKGVEEEEERGV